MRWEVQPHLASGGGGRQVGSIEDKGRDLPEAGQSKPPNPDAVPMNRSFSLPLAFGCAVDTTTYVNSEAHRLSEPRLHWYPKAPLPCSKVPAPSGELSCFEVPTVDSLDGLGPGVGMWWVAMGRRLSVDRAHLREDLYTCNNHH